MNKLVPLGDLFTAVYGSNLELLNMEECPKHDSDAMRFVSRTETNNGISAYVKSMEEVSPNPSRTLSTAVSGSVLSSFYQDKEYYSGRDVYYLVPKKKMTAEEMIFYAHCIKANRYKYNYGRAANKTLRKIMLPGEMSEELKKITIASINIPTRRPLAEQKYELNPSRWEWFEIQELFEVKKGKRLTKEDITEGRVPFIASIDSTNGCREFIGQPPIHPGNAITVNYNGSVAEAFYQPKPFWASDDVNVLCPKFKMDPYIALFMVTLIKAEKYRFNYGRKWHTERMNTAKIKLPTKSKHQPDFDFMGNFIKSLPYSSAL